MCSLLEIQNGLWQLTIDYKISTYWSWSSQHYEIRNQLWLNKNFKNPWDAAGEKKKKQQLIAIQSYLRKQEKFQINNLILHLKQLEKEENPKPKVSRRKEIIKIGGEINEREAKKTKQKSVKLKVGSVRK